MEMRMNRNLRKVAAVLAIAVFSVVLTVPALAASDEPIEIDDVWYVFDDTNMTATVTSTFEENEGGYQINYTGDVVIPPYVEYDGRTYEVTEIGPGTFYASVAHTLHIPETVVKVYADSFDGMVSLRSVTVDELNPALMSVDGVLYSRDMKILWLYPRNKAMKDDFSGMLFEEYVIPEGVEEILTSFFHTDLKRLILPSTLKTAGAWAFACETLTEINLPDSMEHLYYRCFCGLEIESELRIPQTVTYIGDYCFERSRFTSIVLPENITCIGEGWFEDCYNLATVNLHEGITKICARAFRCSVKDLKLPESLSELEENAFQGIWTSAMVLPDGLKELPDNLFEYSSIRRVTLGNGIERIGSIFTNCGNIADIYCPMETPPDIDSKNPLGLIGEYDIIGKVNVHVRKGCAQAYLDSPWKLVGPIIEDLTDGVNEVGDDMAIHDDELCEAYSLSGATVASRLRFGEVSNALPKGLYIIRTDSGKSEKIIVK